MRNNQGGGNESAGSIFTILFLIFLVLKLTGTITWSWWWVTAPLWGGSLLLFLIYFGLIAYFAWKSRGLM
jgi:hypothetical protein